MSALPESFKLNTGATIPAVGLGTWRAAPGEVRSAVAFALKNGYRHLDCALIYQNEHEVGQGIKDSGVPRSEIFITSKLWNTHHPDVAAGLEQTLKALGTDYLDLYLVHWPVRLVPNEGSELLPVNPDGTRAVDRDWDMRKTWAGMEQVYQSGKVKAIGLANWSIPYIKYLQPTWKVVPAVNQVEMHPYCPQHELKKFCQDLGMVVEAYSPLGSANSPILGDEQVKAIADKHGVSPATILISYHPNRGVVVLPKSVQEKRLIDNQKVIKLDAEDMKILDEMAANGKQQRVTTPLWGWDLGFDDWYGPKK